MLVAAFYFKPLLMALVWACLLVLNLWIFQKAKAQGALFMLIGAGLLALSSLLWAFGTFDDVTGFWLPLIGAVLITFGYFQTVKTQVMGNIEALKAKLHKTSSGGGEGGSKGS